MSSINKIKTEPSFGSLIQISQRAYNAAPLRRLYRSGKYIDSPWSIFDSKYFKEGYTDDASFCSAGVIKNSDGDGFMFHLKPNQDLNLVYENLEIATENLQRPRQKLTGLLVGGNVDYKPSVRLYEMLQEIFKQLKIDYSALLGQKQASPKFPKIPTSNLYYNGVDDRYALGLVNKDNLEIYGMKYLKRYFDTIRIRKGDKIKFD